MHVVMETLIMTPRSAHYFTVNETLQESSYQSSKVTIAFQAALYGVLTLFGSLLNGCVLWLVYKKRSLRTVTNMWVVSLCLSQLLLSLLSLPLAIISTIADAWLLGETFCKIYGFYTSSIRTVSVISVAGIALDRYHVITRPFGARIRKSSARIFIALTWWCAAIACVPPLVGISLFRYSPLTHTCGISWSLGGSALVYTVFYILSTYVLSFVLACCAYKLIYKVTKKQARKRRRPSVAGGLATVITNTNNINKNNNNNNSSEGNESITLDTSQGSNDSNQANNTVPISPARRRLTSIFAHRSLSMTYSGLYRLSGLLAPSSFLQGSIDSRAAQTIVLVLSVFILTWLPYYILALYSAATGGNLRSRYNGSSVTSLASAQWLEYMVTWLSFSNVVWDPLVYGFFNHNFRNHLKDMWCFRRCQERNYWRKRARRNSSSLGEEKMSSRRNNPNNWDNVAEQTIGKASETLNTTMPPANSSTPLHQRHHSRTFPFNSSNLLRSTSENNEVHTLPPLESTRHFLPQVVIVPTAELKSVPRLHSAASSIASARTCSVEDNGIVFHTQMDGLRYLEVPSDGKYSRSSPNSSKFNSLSRKRNPNGQYDNRVFELPLVHATKRLHNHRRQHSYTPTLLSPLASTTERARRKRISSNETSLQNEELFVHL